MREGTAPVLATSCILCTPETHVASRAGGSVRASRRNPVAVAVGVVTQVRPSSDNPCLTVGRAGRIVVRTTGVEARVKPVRAPLPDVAGDVVEAVSVRLELVYGSRAEVTVFQHVT